MIHNIMKTDPPKCYSQACSCCLEGHQLEPSGEEEGDWICDVCNESRTGEAWRCQEDKTRGRGGRCDYDVCSGCRLKYKVVAGGGREKYRYVSGGHFIRHWQSGIRTNESQGRTGEKAETGSSAPWKHPSGRGNSGAERGKEGSSHNRPIYTGSQC